MTTGQAESAPRGLGQLLFDNAQQNEPTGIRSAGLGTMLLVSLAAVVLTATRCEWSGTPWVHLGSGVLYIAVPWSIRYALRSGETIHRRLNAAFPAVIIAWVAFPFLAEFVLRQFGVGDAPEMIMILGMQNAALITAAYDHRPRCRQVACLLAAFVVLFSVTTGSTLTVFLPAGLFGVVILWWLMVHYWNRVQTKAVAACSDQCLPMRTSVLAVVSLVGLVIIATLGTTGASTYVLEGFMPSSGGNRWSDDFARSGVNEGDAMVAATDDAQSFGAIDSELFLDSEMPSLYDMFNDMYGEPAKRKKSGDRAIAISGPESAETEKRISETQRSGREFSAVRRRAKRRGAPSADRKSAAMLYVVGRVPLHLAMEKYDVFDGREWKHSGIPTFNAPVSMRRINDKPWAQVGHMGASPIHRGSESHALKIINLKTNRFPMPPHLTAVHVDKVDRLEFFGWTDDGIVEMPVREKIPRFTVMHLTSQGMNLEPLREADFSARLPRASKTRLGDERSAVDVQGETIERHLKVVGKRDELARVAAQWTRDVPRGWRQVEAVVNRLRQDFVLDFGATAPADCKDTVAHFLDQRRGPDYLFATTAAMLLRELGYPTRMVSGFYASEQRYDRTNGQTAVLAEDVHVWVEITIDGRTWVPIEPTPGYQHPPESLTWTQQIALTSYLFGQWCLTNIRLLAFGIVGLVTVWFFRLTWLDGGFRLFCWVAGRFDGKRRVLWTIRLLEWRAWLAGHPRPSATSVSRWHGALAASLPAATSECLLAALRSAEFLLYSPARSFGGAEMPSDLATACGVVDRHVGIACFRNEYRKSSPSESGTES